VDGFVVASGAMNEALRLEKTSSIFGPLSIATALFAGWYLAPEMMKVGAGAIAAAVILVLGFSSPVFGLAALLVITPFQPFVDFYAPHLGSVYAGAAMRDGLLAAIALAWIVRRIFPREPARELMLPEKLALAYLGVLAVWIVPAPSFAGGLVGYRNLSGFLILLLVTSEVCVSQERRTFLLRVFLVVALCSAVVGILEFLTNRAFFDLIHYDVYTAVGTDLPFSYGVLPRASGGTGNPLDFGFYMAIAATLSAAFLTGSGRGPCPRWFLWVVVLATSLAAILSLSRSAFIPLAVGILGTGLMLRPRRVWVWALVMVLVIGVAAYTPAGEILADRLMFSDQSGVETAASRWEIWKVVLSNRTSLLGAGLGTQGAALGRSGLAPTIAGVGMLTDNYYGSILMQVGIIPLLVFLALLGALAKGFYRHFRSMREGQEWTLAAASFMFVVMIALDAAFSSSLESRAVMVEIWTLLGIAAAFTFRTGDSFTVLRLGVHPGAQAQPIQTGDSI
jgi:hypothetical protein